MDRQKIAIVGAGVAGSTCAWALAPVHEVTLYEAAAAPGGHAKTLGGNVALPLPDGLRLDTGVVLYERRNFPVAHRLFDRLGVALRDVPGATGLYLDARRSWLSPFGVRDSGHPLWLAPARALRLLPLRRDRRAFVARVARLPRDALLEHTIGDFLADDDLSTWLRLLLMYAWSTPYERTAALPAAMAVPMLLAFVAARGWTAVAGGTWTFVAALLDRLDGRVRTGTRVARVVRGADGVEVVRADGTAERFDQVVLAAGPDQVLALLADPTADERRRFGAWGADEIETVVHRDDGPWTRRRLDYRSEFDLFRTACGDHGYNACLNRIAGLAGPPWYGLSFHLLDELDPSSVIWVQRHRVPRYTVEAVRHVDAVRAHNGERRTWHAGAWLGDGLQEGAIRSALEVARALGAPEAAALIGPPAPP